MGSPTWMSRCDDAGRVETRLWLDDDHIPPGWFDSPGEAMAAANAVNISLADMDGPSVGIEMDFSIEIDASDAEAAVFAVEPFDEYVPAPPTPAEGCSSPSPHQPQIRRGGWPKGKRRK